MSEIENFFRIFMAYWKETNGAFATLCHVPSGVIITRSENISPYPSWRLDLHSSSRDQLSGLDTRDPPRKIVACNSPWSHNSLFFFSLQRSVHKFDALTLVQIDHIVNLRFPRVNESRRSSPFVAICDGSVSCLLASNIHPPGLPCMHEQNNKQR